MKLFPVPCSDRGHINVLVVLQSYTDSLQVLPSSSSEAFPTSSDDTYDVGSIKVEEGIDIKKEEMYVKTEKVIGSEKRTAQI